MIDTGGQAHIASAGWVLRRDERSEALVFRSDPLDRVIRSRPALTYYPQSPNIEASTRPLTPQWLANAGNDPVD
jgi:hypothetical protein